VFHQVTAEICPIVRVPEVSSLSSGGTYAGLSGLPIRIGQDRPSWRGGQAVSDAGSENKARNREIARNESARQTTGDIRVSTWAIAVAVIIGLAAIGWVLIHNR
jgi:hypothetical protein